MSRVAPMIQDLVVSESRNLINKLNHLMEFASNDAEFFPAPGSDLTNYAQTNYPYLPERVNQLLVDHPKVAGGLLSDAGFFYTETANEPRVYFPNGLYLRLTECALA